MPLPPACPSMWCMFSILTGEFWPRPCHCFPGPFYQLVSHLAVRSSVSPPAAQICSQHKNPPSNAQIWSCKMGHAYYITYSAVINLSWQPPPDIPISYCFLYFGVCVWVCVWVYCTHYVFPTCCAPVRMNRRWYNTLSYSAPGRIGQGERFLSNSWTFFTNLLGADRSAGSQPYLQQDTQ